MRALAALILPLALVACGETDTILPGEREAIAPASTVAQLSNAPALRLPAARANSDWPQRRGSASHLIAHPAVGNSLAQVLAVNIGAGETRRHRITADPVVADGRVFVIDAQSKVSAVSTAGAPLWSRALVPALESSGQGGANGLAVAGGVVYATSGYGELYALNASSGEVVWTQELGASGSAAPTVAGELVYVVDRDNRAWAVERETGRVRWTLNGVPAAQGVGGGSGVAVGEGMAVVPFRGGEIVGAFAQGGLRRWSTNLTGERTGHASATISDLTGDPVIDGGRVYVGNISGRAVALNLSTGERLWTVPMAAKSPVWPAGGSVFLVNDLNELVRLDASSGAVVWSKALPGLEDKRVKRRKRFYAHHGPILASGRLIVASSDKMLRVFDPASGALVQSVELPSGAASGPAVAGGTLYVVTSDGVLRGFR